MMVCRPALKTPQAMYIIPKKGEIDGLRENFIDYLFSRGRPRELLINKTLSRSQEFLKSPAHCAGSFAFRVKHLPTRMVLAG